MPWRKGPFHVHGIHIDTEWRSDWKWDRVLPHISPLQGRYVLDVGCGSGYHLWRMVGKGRTGGRHRPEPAVPLPVRSHSPLRWQRPARHLLPLGIQELAGAAGLRHRLLHGGALSSQVSHRAHRAAAQPAEDDGELVLETLVVDGGVNDVLVPTDRYGKMRNVWFIPSSAALTLGRALRVYRCADCRREYDQHRRTASYRLDD
jgi:tRNA (mo5U34)-methyltransferase